MSLHAVLTGTILSLALLAVPNHAQAGLQKWSVLYLDANGKPTTYGRAKSAEIYAYDSRGYHISIGCAPDGGHSIAVAAPEGAKAKFAKIDRIEPSLRIGKPGTDLFLGPIGAMYFDGERYVGKIPELAYKLLLKRIRDGLITFAELNSHTTIKLKMQGIERSIGEVNCK